MLICNRQPLPLETARVRRVAERALLSAFRVAGAEGFPRCRCQVFRPGTAPGDLAPQVELSVALVDDAQMRALNRRYRRQDRTTDVLAFPQQAVVGREQSSRPVAGRWSLVNSCEPQPTRNQPRATSRGFTRNQSPVLLGDVVISVETAARRAGSVSDRLSAEVARYLIHGILHLLGWEHETQAQRQRMRQREREVWSIAWDNGHSGGRSATRSKG